MEAFKPPGALNLNGNLRENWRRWIQRFELFLTASGKVKEAEKVQCAILLHLIGDEALEIYNTFTFGEGEDRDKLTVLKKKFEDYVNPRKNTVFERYKFWECKQQDGETIDQFITELKTRARSCEFGDQTESLIRDRIVFGVSDVRLKERLLRESSDLTLGKAASLCRAAEESAKQLKELRKQNDDPGEPEVHTMKKSPRGESLFDCNRCGTKHAVRSCPAFGKSCHKCKKKNHFARMCPMSKNSSVDAIQEDAGDGSFNDHTLELNSLFIGTINSSTSSAAWFASVNINGVPVRFKLDTGAEANVLPLSVYSSLKVSKSLKTTNVVLSSYGNFKVKPKGRVDLRCAINGRSEMLPFFVVPVQSTPILGLQACEQLNLVKKVDEVTPSLSTKESIIREYPEVFKGLGCMDGDYHIVIDETVKPVIHPPRKVPYSILGKLQEKLSQLEKSGVVRKVDKPTPWVNSLVIVEKRDGSLRLCLDPRDLNKAIQREHHRIPTAEDIATRLSGKKLFSIVDEKDGFWQIHLDEESSYLCTFNTPFGRYRFTRLPFGVCSAPEVFQKKNEVLFGDIDGVEVIFDDIIVAAQDEKEHDEIMAKLLERAKAENVKFNPDKLQYKVKEVKYMGNVVSELGLKPDSEKVRAIVDMPLPKSKEELRRFLGMVNFFSKFIPHQSSITDPLRQLLKQDSVWVWSHEHIGAVEELKQILSSQPVLKFFDPTKPVKLQVDASKGGLGACLLQDGHPVAYASRSLSSAEQNYAQIEKELTAVVFGCEKFHCYVYGSPIEVDSDHKPLVSISTKPLAQASPRLQRLLLRLQKYNVTINYLPGKYMFVADALSRAFLPDGPVQDDMDEDVTKMIHSIVGNLPMTADKLADLKSATVEDEVMQQIVRYVKDGWPSTPANIPFPVSHYWKFRDEIYEADGLLFFGQKLIIPEKRRPDILRCIHESHLGMEKCKSRARAVVYWPGMSADIERLVAKCSTCLKHQRNNQKEPLKPHQVPARAWQKLGTDIFEYKSKPYLVIVDYYSKYPEICLLNDKSSQSVIASMKSVFARHGIPDEVVADNVPFSSKECLLFAKEWGFKISTSSPRYPQSNGMSERAIQTIKNLLRKADEDGHDHYVALLEYRNTPITGMQQSPAQLLMSRMLKSKLPTTMALLQPEVQEHVRERLEQRAKTQKEYFDRNAKPLQPVKMYQSARIRQGKVWEPAVITGMHKAPRSFLVTTPQGGVYRRNRRHLLPTSEPPPNIVGPDYDEEIVVSEREPDNVVVPQPVPVRRTSNRQVRLPERYRNDYVMV